MEHLYEFQEYFYNKCHWDKNITIPDPFWQTQSKTEGHLRAPIFEEKLVQQKQTAKGGPVEWSRRERLRLSSWAGGGGGAFSAWGTLDATVPNLCGARAGHLTNQCLQEGSSLLTGEFPCFWKLLQLTSFTNFWVQVKVSLSVKLPK